MKYSKAITANTDLDSVQAFVFQKPDEDILFAILISATGEGAFTLIRQNAFLLEQIFFESKEQIPTRFGQCFEMLQTALQDLSQVQILLVSSKKDLLYIQTRGSHKVYLYRDSQISQLTGQADNEGSLSQLVSGHVQELDRLLLVSESIDHFQDKNPIQALIKCPQDDLEAALSDFIRDTPGALPLASILIDFAKEQALPIYSGERESVKRLPKLNLVKVKQAFLTQAAWLLKKAIPRTKKTWFIAIFGLGVLVVGLGIYLSVQYKIDAKKKQLQGYLALAQSKLETAKSLTDQDTQAAKANFEESKQLVEKVLRIDSKNSAASKLAQELSANQNNVFKISEVTNWPLFLDLELIKKDLHTKKLTHSLNKVVLFDPEQKTLVLLDLKLKSNVILGGQDQLGKIEAAGINGDFVFVFSPDKGITVIDAPSKKITANLKADPEWGKIADLVGFAGNIYLADSVKSQIWKYVPTAKGYSDKFEYFSKDQPVDLVGMKKILIDSSVWVLKSEAQLSKYTSGAKDFFAYSKLDKNIANVTSFFVSDETENVYLIDPENSQLLIVKKTGEYVSALSGDKFKTADDLLVDEAAKKIYLLESNKIFLIDLP